MTRHGYAVLPSYPGIWVRNRYSGWTALLSALSTELWDYRELWEQSIQKQIIIYLK